LVNEVSTLRRHLQAQHRKKYIKWCDCNDFQSKLPSDVKARKEKAASNQTTLDGHAVPIEPAPPSVKYSDALFRQVVEEWLIATNQPLQCVDHPKFHELIDVASRATEGVKIPTRQATRESIIDRFKKNVAELSAKFNV
ncbi:hypothetical protein FA13DRAFT_1603760, partial [Coprinellus micaceus]